MDKYQALEKKISLLRIGWSGGGEFYSAFTPAFTETIKTFCVHGMSRENSRSKQVGVSRWIQGTMQNMFLILGKNHSIDWQDLQEEISQVTAREYVIGSQIQRKDSQHIRQFRWWIFSLMTAWLVMQAADNFYHTILDAILMIMLLVLSVFTVKIFFVDLPGYMQNMAKRLNLWEDGG